MNDKEVLEALYATVENRRDNPKEGSYTCYLLDKGIDKILKKVGEESVKQSLRQKMMITAKLFMKLQTLSIILL